MLWKHFFLFFFLIIFLIFLFIFWNACSFRFDSETQNLMNDLRQEKAQRERLAREKEIAIAEKFTIEQNLSVSKAKI